MRRHLGLTYWSLSQWAKLKVKDAVNLIGDFENALVAEAKRYKVDGIIGGHIHHAAMRDRLGLRYINGGDWVESCTAVGETYAASLRLSAGPTRGGMIACPYKGGEDGAHRGLMPIVIATDAWHPQVNGVVRSLQHTAEALVPLGVDTEFVTHAQFRTVGLPSYPEIRLSIPYTATEAERHNKTVAAEAQGNESSDAKPILEVSCTARAIASDLGKP